MTSQEAGRDEKAVSIYPGLPQNGEGQPVPPPEILQFYAMWQKMPVVYTRFTDAEGNCIGFDWACDNDWSARHPGAFYEFLQFRDAHDVIWDWLAMNPENRITAKNFLKVVR